MTPRRSGRQKKFKHKPRKKSNKLPLAIGLLIIIIAVITVVYVFATNNPSSPTPGGTVLLKTSMGDITIQLRDDRPITTTNFKNLVQQGVYDGTIFHRVIYGFVVQGGDPTGTGYGDPSIANIQDELDGDNHNNRCTVAMAKSFDPTTGKSVPNSGSSQFFINLEDNNDLDAEYSVFGTVISGMNIVDEIANVATDVDNRPVIDVELINAEIIG
jgi:peptidylprolyl isomerase